MLILPSTSAIIRVVTGAAANSIDVYAAWADMTVATEAIDAGSLATVITTATTTTVVPAPASGVRRNVQGIYITNDSAGTSCPVAVEYFDGSTQVELIQFILLPGENLGYREDGSWVHRDAQGAEYPPSGLGMYNGRSVGFMKTGTASDAAGYWYCTSKDGGFPGAWAPGTPGINGRNTDGTTAADAGCIPIANASTGANYLTELQMAASVNHSHLLFDCLWVNSGIAIATTTLQAIASGTLPARDINGTTNGEGCMIAILCTAAVGLAAAAANATVSYTNSDGVAGRTATLTAIVGSQAPATPVIGTLIWFNLQAGDKGVRSIQGITLGTTWVSGTISLMITRDIATIGTTIPNVTAQKIIGTPGIKLYSGTCMLHAVLTSATTATFFSGELTIMEK